MKKKITILVPVYNEEEVLEILYARISEVMSKIPQYDYEVLCVNDGSTDKSLEILKNLREKDEKICYLNLSRNYGKDIAMMCGFDFASGDCTVIIDADLQDPPELIPEMLKYWEEGYEDIYARRKSRDGETWFKKWTSKQYYKLLQKTTKIKLQVDTGDFRLLDKRCVEALKKIREYHRYTKGMFSWIGYKKKEIIFERPPRVAGETKYNYQMMVSHAIDGIVSFTILPLRLAAFVGAIVSISAFIYMAFTIIQTFFYREIMQKGYPSLMTVMLFLGGVQLLFLGIIGEYVGRIFNETKNRPLYLLDEFNGKKL